jgi:hypothetical protein
MDPGWVSHVGHLIDWVKWRFGRGPFLGAWGIDEQGTLDGRRCCSRAGLGSDTSRWAAINAMYYEKTGEGQARDDAFRSLNYATYFAASDGKISCCGQGFDGQYWFSDGYADSLRHFNWAMGAMPQLAPQGENRLLRSTSVVQQVKYGDKSVSYRTFDEASTEVLRLAFNPVRISAGGSPLSLRDDLKEEGCLVQPLPGGDYVVRVRHVHGRDVSLFGR